MPYRHTYETLTPEKLLQITRGKPFVRCIDFRSLTIFDENTCGFKIYENKKYFSNEHSLKIPIEDYHALDSGRGGTNMGMIGFLLDKIDDSIRTSRVTYYPRINYCEFGYKPVIINNELQIRERIHIDIPTDINGFYIQDFDIINGEHHFGRGEIRKANVRLLTLSGNTYDELEVNFLDEFSQNGDNFDFEIIIYSNLTEQRFTDELRGDTGSTLSFENPLSYKEFIIIPNKNIRLLCNIKYDFQKQQIQKYLQYLEETKKIDRRIEIQTGGKSKQNRRKSKQNRRKTKQNRRKTKQNRRKTKHNRCKK